MAALGAASTASASKSVALGYGSVADRANSVSVGSSDNQRQITNVAAGVSSTDAVNMGQLNAVSGRVGTLESEYAGQQTQINALNSAVFSMRRDLRRGIAAAAASAGIVYPSAPGKTTLNMNVASYEGEGAISLAVAHRLGTSVPVVVHFSASVNSGKPITRAGMAVEF